MLQQVSFKSGGRTTLEQGGDRPILLLLEGLNLSLAFNDQAQRHGLHPSGGNSLLHFLPEQRRDLVTHQAVKDAPRLLRVHQLLVNFAGMLEGLADGVARDFVEEHAVEFTPLAVQ